MKNRDYYYEQEVDFDAIEITIEKVNGIGITRMEDETGNSYFKGSDVVNLLKVFNDVPKSFTIGKVIEADLLFDIDGVIKYDEKTNKATKYSPYWLTLEALDSAFEESRYNTEYVFETLNLLNDLVGWYGKHEFVYKEKYETEVEDKLEVNDKYGTVISSRLVAQQMGKEHKYIVKRIEEIISGLSCGKDSSTWIIPSVFKDSRGTHEYKEYLLTKDGFTLLMFNTQGYNDFKVKYIERFNEMEKNLNKLKVIENDQWANKFLKSYEEETETYTATEIAGELGIDVIDLNKWLNQLGLQRRIGTTWVINDRYAQNGFTTFGVYGQGNLFTKWTDKGREFIHNLYQHQAGKRIACF